MKLLPNVREAKAEAAAGGQGLHVYSAMPTRFPSAPAVFKRHPEWAHLFDQDLERLVATARRLGVRVIKVDREGEPGQHIDLCGAPLARARQACTDVQ